MSARAILLAVSIVSAGLIGGLMFGWSVSILPGLRRVNDITFVTTMQNINRAIINPGFTLPFVATPLILAAATIAQFRAGDTRRAALLASACLTYIVGVVGVTAGGNIPLNNTLDAFDVGAADPGDIAGRRTSFEGPWNRWHAVRTVASVMVLALASVAAAVADESE